MNLLAYANFRVGTWTAHLLNNSKTAANSTYKKLVAQWLIEAFCFVSGFVVPDSLVLRNRQLLVGAKRLRYGKLIRFIKLILFT